MSFRTLDGFDNYTDLTLKYNLLNSNSYPTPTSVQAGSKRLGVAGLRYQPLNNFNSVIDGSPNMGIQEPFGVALSTVIVGFAMRPTQYPTIGAHLSHGPFLTFADGSFRQVSFHMLQGGQIVVMNGDNTILGTTTRSIMLNIFRYLEFKVTFHATTGAVDIRADEQSILSLSNVQTKKGSGGNQATSYIIGSYNPPTGGNANPIQFDLDDLAVLDTNGTINNNFVGDVAAKTDFPTSNSTPLNFTRGGTDSGANFSQVDENPPTGDTDYVTSATVGNIDHYGFPAASATVIKCIALNMIARKTDGTARSIRASCKSGATTADSGVDLPLSINYAMYQGFFENDPNTGNPWTVANLNAAVKGPKVTV